MSTYAIADLHLSSKAEKSMDVFGVHWKNHAAHIAKNWMETVREDDTVIIAGDLSWAMKLDEAMEDMGEVLALPGTKVLLRGNHDFWWSSIQRLRDALPCNAYAIQNDSFTTPDGLTICGTRGWILPGSSNYVASDDRIYEREIMRLELSLQHAAKQNLPCDIAILHYPPLNDKAEDNGFTRLLEAYHVPLVLYGHLHGASAHRNGFQGERNGTVYQLISCDYLNFKPVLVRE